MRSRSECGEQQIVSIGEIVLRVQGLFVYGAILPRVATCFAVGAWTKGACMKRQTVDSVASVTFECFEAHEVAAWAYDVSLRAFFL